MQEAFKDYISKYRGLKPVTEPKSETKIDPNHANRTRHSGAVTLCNIVQASQCCSVNVCRVWASQCRRRFYKV